MNSFKYIELFAGIGGFRQALDKLGGQCVFASEIDKFAKQSYEALYGSEDLHGDITKVDEKDIPNHDILVAGMPCQAFSVAGKRLGFEDTRGTLFFEVAKIAKEKQPKVVWIENVKGLVGHDGGKTLDTIVKTLNDIGYTVDFNVLNSKYFGVPQNRERIFIVALRDDLAIAEPWNIEGTNVVAKGKRRLSEYEGIKTFNFDWPSQGSVTTRLRDILEPIVDERYYLSEEKTAKLVAQLAERDTKKLYSDSDAMMTDDGIGHKLQVKSEITPPMRAQGGGRTPGIWVIQEAQSGVRLREDSGTLRKGGTDHQHIVEPNMLGHIELKGHDAIKRVYDPEFISPTLTTMGGGHREPKIAESSPRCRIRKLTPKECLRLQGFSDEQYQTLVDAGLSNSQIYKQAGNAVTVNVIEAIGVNLLAQLSGTRISHRR